MKKIVIRKDNHAIEGWLSDTWFRVDEWILNDEKQRDSILKSLIRVMKNRRFCRVASSEDASVCEGFDDSRLVDIINSMSTERFVYECIEPYLDNNRVIEF